ncbi:MAG TPA: hypothetical protein VMX94_08930 [Armatimonadota bacterium]|nr:hypothetical protein [Armatimonadota bacterium]
MLQGIGQKSTFAARRVNNARTPGIGIEGSEHTVAQFDYRLGGEVLAEHPGAIHALI